MSRLNTMVGPFSSTYQRSRAAFSGSTQVESRLPTLQPRRSLLPGPKTVHHPPLRASDAKPAHLSTATPNVPFRHLQVGQRVETTDGRAGHLHFKGKTHFAQGCMCGIELDDPIGKHDGSVDGIHYFECPQGYGVFVPAHKVHNLPPPSPSSPTSTLSYNSSTSICSRDSKEAKPSSRIPTLGLPSGKLPRPKTLPFSKESQANSKLKPNKKNSKNIDCGKSDTSSEKSSTSSKLFQSKKISPVRNNITHSGWTGDNRTKGNSGKRTDTQNHKHKPNHNTTFNVSDTKRQYARVNSTQDKSSRSSGGEQTSKSLLQQKLARNKNVNGKLNSRPSLNDLTRTFEDIDGEESKPDIVEGCYSKLNETFELDKEVSSFFQDSCSGSLGWDDSHSLSPLEDSSSGRDKSDSSLAWDFEVSQSSTPVQVHLQVSSDIRTSIPEEPRIYPLGIGATAPAFPVDSLSSCDTENTDEEVEYNEFLAIPAFLDTPTGRYKFDLLTPEELEQALNEYNLLPEELQDAIEFEPQFSDVKPRIWEPITTVEDEFLRESSNALYTVPFTAMDPELREKYEGFETPTVDSQATTPIGIASNGMEVDSYPEEFYASDPREYPSVLPTPTSDDHHSGSTGSSTVVNSDKYDELVQSQGALSDANDTTLVDNPSSMDDGVDLSEDFEMEVDPHNTTYDVDLDIMDEKDGEESTFVIEKCPEERQEGDGQEVKCGMLFESNNNGQVPMTPVDLLEGTPHVKTCDTQAAGPGSDKPGSILVSAGTDVEVSQANGMTSGKIVTTIVQETCFPVTVSETQHAKLERVMMDTEEDLKFRMDEMAVEANMVDLDENKSVESESSRTESDRATDKLLANPKPHSAQPNGELQAVMEVGMCLMSQNGHPVTNGGRSGNKDSTHHQSKEDEKKDEEKPNGTSNKRKSLLLTPKKVSKNLATQSSHFQVTLSRPKTGTAGTAATKPVPVPANGEKDNKKTYTPSSWRNEKNSTATKSSVIPRRRSGENRAHKDKNHPARHSADAAHMVQKLQPILDVKDSRKAESTSSMEVDPGSFTSSTRSMRSALTTSSTNSKLSTKTAPCGKPTNKTTLSLRNSSDTRRHERKPSSSSATSDHALRPDSRASVSSRPGSSSSREDLASNKSAASSTTTRSRQTGSTSTGRNRSGTKTSQDASTSNCDAAPAKRPATAAKKSSDHHSKKASQKDPHSDSKHGHHKAKTTAHSLHSSPPDLVYTSLVNGDASQEIKRLEAVCETRFHALSQAKEQLKQAARGFDAMAVLNQYLTQEVDAFSAPQLKAQNAELEKQVAVSAAKIAQQEGEISKLQDELRREIHTHEEELRRMELLHLDEIRNLDESHRNKHCNELQALANEHAEEIRNLTDSHQQEMCDMTASHQSLVHDIEDQHAEHLCQLQEEQQEHLETVAKEKEAETDKVRSEAQDKARELTDEMFQWKYQYECQAKRTQELEEALRRDDDSKVQAAIAQYKHLPDEVASMKAVLEIKNHDIHELRKAKMALEKEVETIPEKNDRIRNLMAKVEDVKALMVKKTDYERQLSSEHVHLRESYERESHTNKRLSMENEELMWRLSQGAESLTPPPRFKPVPSPSPTPSPTGARKGFSRSSSTESHESGVFSPNPPH